jgi:hypothetical protein
MPTAATARTETASEINSTRGSAWDIGADVPNSKPDPQNSNSAIEMKIPGTRLEDCKFQDEDECDKVAQLLVKKFVELQVKSIIHPIRNNYSASFNDDLRS